MGGGGAGAGGAPPAPRVGGGGGGRARLGGIGVADGEDDGVGAPVRPHRPGDGQREGGQHRHRPRAEQGSDDHGHDGDEADGHREQEPGSSAVGGDRGSQVDVRSAPPFADAQNVTSTGPLEASSASKYSRSLKLMALAMNTAGNVWIFVLYRSTVSL